MSKHILPTHKLVQIRKLVLWLLCPFLISAQSSCRPDDTDKDGLADDADLCPTVYAKTKDGCLVKREIKNIHFYIDASGSMRGYFNGDTEFKAIVADLATKVNVEIKPIDIWFIADTRIKYNGTVAQFIHDIAITPIANQKSSELHKIFTEVAANTAPDDVSFIVSDCILSFPDKDVKHHPEINKTEANNSLRLGIYKTFRELKNNKQAVGVYGFRSKFYGTYYNYQNKNISLNGNSRPYYIWVVANKEILKGFIERIGQISTFEPEKFLYFGLTEEPVKSYNILSQIERSGSWNIERKKIVQAELPSGSSLDFCLGLNLENVPAYAKDISYLQKKLQIVTDGCIASFQIKSKTSIDRGKIKGKPQNDLFKEATHLVVVSISKMDVGEATVGLRLPVEYDTWYEDWSCEDDKNFAVQDITKTFAFKYLINGVKEAYETRTKNYIDISIPISK